MKYTILGLAIIAAFAAGFFAAMRSDDTRGVHKKATFADLATSPVSLLSPDGQHSVNNNKMNTDQVNALQNTPMIRHVASIGEIVEDVAVAVAFYRDILGMKVEYEQGSPYAVVKITGVCHYGIWSRAHAAESLFGDAGKAEKVPLGFSVSFEAESIDSAVGEIKKRGVNMLQEVKKEPWGQQTARFLTATGALAELAETPWARTLTSDHALGNEK